MYKKNSTFKIFKRTTIIWGSCIQFLSAVKKLRTFKMHTNSIKLKIKTSETRKY